jgi:hypothetical protein
VANATGFGRDFRMFALLVLPVVLLVGVATYFRLVEADIEDAWLVIGMNRLRHAYLELAPELEPYFVASYCSCRSPHGEAHAAGLAIESVDFKSA